MIYCFNQNNSGGCYTEPAKNIVVNARDENHAIEIAIGAGMYLGGVADGSDCECCGDRWLGYAEEYDSLDKAVTAVARDSFATREDDGIPLYVIVEQFEKPTDAAAIMTMAGSDKYFQVGDDHFVISQ